MNGWTRRSFLRAAFAASLDAGAVGANTAITGYGLYQAIDVLRELGFPAIEIHPMGRPEPTPGQFPGFEFDRLAGAEKARLREALRGFRHVTTHLPYTDLHYFSRFEPVAEFSRRRIEVALEATAYFGAKVAVMHPLPASGLTLREQWPEMVRRFREWGEAARKAGLRLALETGYPRSVRDYVRLIREIDHEWVGATIDVGHQGGYEELAGRQGTPGGSEAYNDTTLEIVDRLGSKVFHFHVHDIDPATWKEHRPIGTGFVDYPRLVKKLREIGYRGLLILEIDAPAAEMRKYLADNKRRLEGFLA